MLLLRLWNYLRGYVIILVEGYFLEKFINICIHRQIYLWDVKKQKTGIMKLKISIDGFKLLRPIAKKTNCRIRIVKKRGLPFILHRYKRRKTFIIGAILFVLSIYILTSFVWTIEISGNNKLETQFLMDKLSQHGIKPGVLKYKVNTDKVVNDLMIDVRELAWIGISVKGTKIKVEVAERKERPDIVPKDVACDIIASKDGVIKSVIAKAGLDMVKAGDTVQKGQVLISGRVPNKDEKVPPKLVHAIGEVKARTWYEAACPVEFKRVEKVRTGKSMDSYAIVLFTRRIDLWNGKIPYNDYEKIEISKRLSIGEDLVFPFEFQIDRYYENESIESVINEEDAKQIALDDAYKKASEDIPETAEIVKNDTNYVQDENGGLNAHVVIECIEDIGDTKEIGGN